MRRVLWLRIDIVRFLFLIVLMQALSPIKQAADLALIRKCLSIHFGGIKVDDQLDLPNQLVSSFVIDSHVLRFLRRVGFVSMRADAKTAHNAVMAVAGNMSAGDFFELQSQIKSLGQTVCTHTQAFCPSCPLSDICMQRVENLTTLRALIEKPKLNEALIRTPLGSAMVDLCLSGGLQHGVLHEIFAAPNHETAATAFVAGLVARVAAEKHSLWIRQEFSTHEFGELSPIGLLELGLDPSRIFSLYVTNTNDGLRAANDALSCAALGAVVIEIPANPKILDLTASRRLTLAATQKSVTVFLLRLNAKPDASTAETRWLVRTTASSTHKNDWGNPVFEIDLIRNRHGKIGRWFVEWNCDERIFQSITTDHSLMVSALGNGSVAAA